MELVKIKGRKAAEPPGIGEVIGIILLVFAAIILGLWFYLGTDKIFSVFKFAPADDLTGAITSCQTWAGSSATAAAFCEYKLLGLEGSKTYANCNYVYTVAAKSLTDDQIGFKSSACKQTAVDFCGILKAKTGFKDSVLVEGKSCRSLGVSAA